MTTYHPELITHDGYERLQRELDALTARRREDGGSPPDEELDRRIDDLETALGRARIAEPPVAGLAGIGQRVVLRFAGGSSPVEYLLVGTLEAAPAQRRISVESPVGRALDGCRAGEIVEVETPSGVRSVEILEVGEGDG